MTAKPASEPPATPETPETPETTPSRSGSAATSGLPIATLRATAAPSRWPPRPHPALHRRSPAGAARRPHRARRGRGRRRRRGHGDGPAGDGAGGPRAGRPARARSRLRRAIATPAAAAPGGPGAAVAGDVRTERGHPLQALRLAARLGLPVAPRPGQARHPARRRPGPPRPLPGGRRLLRPGAVAVPGTSTTAGSWPAACSTAGSSTPTAGSWDAAEARHRRLPGDLARDAGLDHLPAWPTPTCPSSPSGAATCPAPSPTTGAPRTPCSATRSGWPRCAPTSPRRCWPPTCPARPGRCSTWPYPSWPRRAPEAAWPRPASCSPRWSCAPATRARPRDRGSGPRP